jgi:neutral amino acid transport system ATP-binding protein
MSILETRGVTKQFGGLTAVDDVDLELEEGEIVGLIGPNGAGKTTYFNCITGYYPPTQGTVRFQGEDVTDLEPWERAREGMVRTFQQSRTMDSMTVLDNVKLTALDHPGENIVPALLQSDEMLDYEQDVEERAYELLERFDLVDQADTYAAQLSGGQRKLLEVARGMMMDPDLFLLDEPYAGVEEAMVGRIANYVRELNEEEDMTFIVIEHGLEALVELVERLVVLHNGEVIADGDPEDVVSDEQVIEVYLASSIE